MRRGGQVRRSSRPARVSRGEALAAGLAFALLAAAPQPEPSEAASPARVGLEASDALAVERLRTAAADLAGGRATEAAAGFAQVREAHPVLADHAERLRIAALAAGGHAEAARDAARGFTRSHASSPVVDLVWRALGDAHAALGEHEDARKAWKEAERRSADAEEQAELVRARAASLEAEGRAVEAAQVWLEIWRDRASVPQAAIAADSLVRLESSLGRPLRTADDWARRSKALAAAYLNAEALDACEVALARGAGLSQGIRDELTVRRADLLFRLRRYPEAALAYEALGPKPEHRLYHARSLARSGRIDEAVERFQTLAAEAQRGLGMRALFLAATLLEDDDSEAADGAYARVAQRAPTADARIEARWRLAWAAYRRGAWQEAEAHLKQVVEDTGDPLDVLRARYWRARAAAELDAAAGEAQLRRIADGFPYTYYGWRARQRLGDGPATAPSATGKKGTLSLGLPRVRWQRARILVAAELEEAARRELAELVPRARRRADRVRLGRLLQQSGDPHAAERLVLDHDLLALAQGPASQLGRDAFELAWPRAFAEWLEPAAARHGAPPAVVYAVMREESGYRPKVLSVVGARGLTQIMPSTGERLAKGLGLAGFHPDDLLVPETNLNLGAYYLSRLLARMEGRISAAVASYNAGPAAVERWLRRDGGLDDDVFVESIPYLQTRRYVKRVLRSIEVYRTLYPELGPVAPAEAP